MMDAASCPFSRLILPQCSRRITIILVMRRSSMQHNPLQSCKRKRRIWCCFLVLYRLCLSLDLTVNAKSTVTELFDKNGNYCSSEGMNELMNESIQLANVARVQKRPRAIFSVEDFLAWVFSFIRVTSGAGS